MQGADGSWYETGSKVSYSDYKTVRNASYIRIPKALHDLVLTYHKQHGFWPFSIDGLLTDGDKEVFLTALKSKEYPVLWIAEKRDTLLITFNFEKLYTIKYN